MRLMRSLLAFLAAVLLTAGLLRPDPAQGQIPTPTPEQLELLKTLTPEQQEALLRQITGGANGTTTEGRTDRRDDQLDRRDGTSRDRNDLLLQRPLVPL